MLTSQPGGINFFFVNEPQVVIGKYIDLISDINSSCVSDLRTAFWTDPAFSEVINAIGGVGQIHGLVE